MTPKVTSTPIVTGRHRLTVFRSHKFIYAQVIDDSKGVTVASSHGKDATKVGEQVAKVALAAKVSQITFDRGRYKYHGQVKALAEAARSAGLKF